MRQTAVLGALLVMCSVLPTVVTAAELRGLVVDQAGRPVPGAKVTIEGSIIGRAKVAISGRALILNFHDTLNVSPLLVDLAARLAQEKDAQGLTELQAAARKIARWQINQILSYNYAPDEGSRFPWYKEMDLPLRAKGPGECDEQQWNRSDEFKQRTGSDLCFRVVGLELDRVEMQLLQPGMLEPVAFHVSYYDLPLVDNTKLPGFGRRLAFVLRSIDRPRRLASVGLLIFPDEITGVRDRPFVEAMVDQLKSLHAR